MLPLLVLNRGCNLLMLALQRCRLCLGSPTMICCANMGFAAVCAHATLFLHAVRASYLPFSSYHRLQ